MQQESLSWKEDLKKCMTISENGENYCIFEGVLTYKDKEGIWRNMADGREVEVDIARKYFFKGRGEGYSIGVEEGYSRGHDSGLAKGFAAGGGTILVLALLYTMAKKRIEKSRPSE